MNKVILLSLVMLMPCVSHAKVTVGVNSSSSSREDMQGDLVGKALGMAVIAPIAGAMKGCERRTLDTMENTVVGQLTSAQQETFKNMYTDHKMDTKPYTTATGPLSMVVAAGVASMNPAGFVIAGLATVGNCGVLFLAEKAQRYNRDRYERAVTAINLEKSLEKTGQINGDAGLSDLQKMFCIGRGSL